MRWCRCCVKNCWKKWTPRDEILRRVRLQGQTVTITQPPFQVADGMCLPVDGLPTGVRSVPGNASPPENCYGVDLDEYRLFMGLEYANQQVYHHEASQEGVGDPIDISSVTMPIEFDPDDDGAFSAFCSAGATGENIALHKSTDYGESFNFGDNNLAFEDVELTLQSSGRLTFDRAIYFRVKAVTGPQGYHSEDPPKTEADRIARGWILYDAGIQCLYNSNVGYQITDVTTPTVADYAIGDNLGFGRVSGFHDLHYRDNIFPGLPGETTSVGLVYGRNVQESLAILPGVRFGNGIVVSGARVSADLRSNTYEAYVQSAEFEDIVPGESKDPVRDCPLLGYPNPIQSFNNAGFSTGVILFDAEWNPDLNQFFTDDIRNTLFCSFVRDTGFDEDSPAHLEITEIPRDVYTFTHLSPPDLATDGIRGSWVNPYFDGTARVKLQMRSSFIPPPFELAPNRPPEVNKFSAGFTGQPDLYTSSCLDGWRKKPEFCCDMESTGEQVNREQRQFNSVTFGDIDGCLVRQGTDGDLPELRAIGEATGSTYCREEYEA